MQLYAILYCLILPSCIAAAKKKKDLQIIVKHKPEDCSVKASVGDHVEVHYTGTLESAVVFDSSVINDRPPLAFTLGKKRVIAGWEQGILGMCVGEKRKLIIPPHLAYGKSGHPPTIPGDATLIFETELVSIKRKSILDFLGENSTLILIPVLVVVAVYYLNQKMTEEAAKKGKKEEKKGRKKKN